MFIYNTFQKAKRLHKNGKFLKIIKKFLTTPLPGAIIIKNKTAEDVMNKNMLFVFTYYFYFYFIKKVRAICVANNYSFIA